MNPFSIGTTVVIAALLTIAFVRFAIFTVGGDGRATIQADTMCLTRWHPFVWKAEVKCYSIKELEI